MAVWPLFKSAPYARCWAAAVPAIITVKFFAVGSCIMKDPQLVASATVSGRKFINVLSMLLMLLALLALLVLSAVLLVLLCCWFRVSCSRRLYA